jgi:hypothetical protein
MTEPANIGHEQRFSTTSLFMGAWELQVYSKSHPRYHGPAGIDSDEWITLGYINRCKPRLGSGVPRKRADITKGICNCSLCE